MMAEKNTRGLGGCGRTREELLTRHSESIFQGTSLGSLWQNINNDSHICYDSESFNELTVGLSGFAHSMIEVAQDDVLKARNSQEMHQNHRVSSTRNAGEVSCITL